LGFILGGTLGNFIDRVRLRAVVDYLDFHIASRHWPAFNLADICICVGAFVFALLALFSSRPDSKTEKRNV
jgi:signal peptidase II